MLDSLVKCKRELQKTVVDEKWEAWMERSATQLKKGAQTCKAAVMDDVWFSKAEELYRLAKCARNSVLLYDRSYCCTTLCILSCTYQSSEIRRLAQMNISMQAHH